MTSDKSRTSAQDEMSEVAAEREPLVKPDSDTSSSTAAETLNPRSSAGDCGPTAETSHSDVTARQMGRDVARSAEDASSALLGDGGSGGGGGSDAWRLLNAKAEEESEESGSCRMTDPGADDGSSRPTAPASDVRTGPSGGGGGGGFGGKGGAKAVRVRLRLRQNENGSTCVSLSESPRKTPSTPDLKRSPTSSDYVTDPRVTSEPLGDAASDDPKPVRRLSSGDRPYWLLQNGAMTLYVPAPTEEVKKESYLIGRANQKMDGAPVRRTRITEVAPTNSSLVGDEEQWKIPLEVFTSKRQGSLIKNFKSKRVRSYYKAQDELITAYEDISLRVADDLLDTADVQKQQKLATFFSKMTLAINFLLMIAKLVASILSGSISIVSSLVDSVVDLVSGGIMWWATRAIRTRDIYAYPQGRTKLEPLAIIILSVIMGLASLELIKESIQRIVQLAGNETDPPDVGIATFVISGSTVAIKFVLWLVCRRVASPIVRALAMDHRNDVMSNTVAIVCGYLGSTEFQTVTSLWGFVFADPIGAILISMYIVFNWWQTGSEQTRMLTGYTARPDFLSKLTWTAMNHDRNVKHIDTVRAFHFGSNFLVELDIVLPEDMLLREAHDIGESLQQKLENIPEVERAFVHLDYEYDHNPTTEHKVV